MTTTTKHTQAFFQEAWKLVSTESKERNILLILVGIASLCSFVIWLVIPTLAPLFDGMLMTLLSLAVIYWTKKVYDTPAEVIKEQPMLLEEVVRKASEHWISAFLTSFVMGLCLIGLFLLFIVPGVIMSVFWAFTLQIVFFEQKSFFAAMGRSRTLISGKWWDMFFLGVWMFVIALGVMILTTIAQFFLQILLSAKLTAILVDFVVNGLGAFFTVVLTLVYFEYTAKKVSPSEETPVVEATV